MVIINHDIIIGVHILIIHHIYYLHYLTLSTLYQLQTGTDLVYFLLGQSIKLAPFWFFIT
jgi:hypothetical protein